MKWRTWDVSPMVILWKDPTTVRRWTIYDVNVMLKNALTIWRHALSNPHASSMFRDLTDFFVGNRFSTG